MNPNLIPTENARKIRSVIGDNRISEIVRADDKTRLVVKDLDEDDIEGLELAGFKISYIRAAELGEGDGIAVYLTKEVSA